MTEDDGNVIPVGSRLGSQRLYEASPSGETRSRAKPDTTANPKPGVAGVGRNPTAGPARGRVTEIASTVLELAGITAIAGGCWLIAPFVGLIVLGISMVVLGVAMGWP